jgi:hypothetical protein
VDSCVHPESACRGWENKHSQGCIDVMQELVHHGHCIKHALQHNGSLASGCTGEHLEDVHREAKAYQGRKHNMTYIAQHYTPETVPSRRCSQRYEKR